LHYAELLLWVEWKYLWLSDFILKCLPLIFNIKFIQ
jgi:hypothetical protein